MSIEFPPSVSVDPQDFAWDEPNNAEPNDIATIDFSSFAQDLRELSDSQVLPGFGELPALESACPGLGHTASNSTPSDCPQSGKRSRPVDSKGNEKSQKKRTKPQHGGTGNEPDDKKIKQFNSDEFLNIPLNTQDLNPTSKV